MELAGAGRGTGKAQAGPQQTPEAAGSEPPGTWEAGCGASTGLNTGHA